MLENIQLTSYCLLDAQDGKGLFGREIPISTIYSMFISHGEKLSTREYYCSVGHLASSFNGTAVSLRHRVCIFMQFILPQAPLLVIKKNT